MTSSTTHPTTTTFEEDSVTDLYPDTLRGPWKALIVHEGWVETDFTELDPEDEVDIAIVRDTALPDNEGKMPGTRKSGDVAFESEDIYVDGEGDPTTAAPAVYARARAMAAGLNAAGGHEPRPGYPCVNSNCGCRTAGTI